MITIRRAIAQVGGETEEKDTKTHQRRHVTIDPGTVEALAEHRRRCAERCAPLEVELSPEAFVFSSSPAGEEHMRPSSVTQRYSKMADPSRDRHRSPQPAELLGDRSRAGSAMAAEGRRRCGFTRRGSPRPTSAPRRVWPIGCPSGRCQPRPTVCRVR